jgi:DNA-binding CsgD family transcriptional regulator
MATTRLPRAAGSAVAGKAAALWVLLGLQAICALFFLVDIGGDLLGYGTLVGGVLHNQFELLAAIALMVSIGITSQAIRRILRRQRRIEVQLRAASGAFWELLEEYFETWALTPSERDIALLAIKGLSIAEIARLRETKEGTVKAQCNAIYGKAGVTGRPQLLSLFIEELLGDGLVPHRAERP